MPASELTGFDVAASDISPDTRELRERLDSHDDRDAIERIIASWLIDRMSGVYDVDGAMMRWAMRIHAAPQEALEASGALSERQHRRRFTAAVGIGPKRFSRIARVQWLLRRAGAANASWAELASAAGFHDQAHLIREFSALTGTTPAAYFTAK
jgi:AraC-like DNA-binding protein